MERVATGLRALIVLFIVAVFLETALALPDSPNPEWLRGFADNMLLVGGLLAAPLLLLNAFFLLDPGGRADWRARAFPSPRLGHAGLRLLPLFSTAFLAYGVVLHWRPDAWNPDLVRGLVAAIVASFLLLFGAALAGERR
jgi:hypothetical protein